MAVRPAEREVSRGHSSRASGEGPQDGEGETPMRLGDAMPQKSDLSPSAQTAGGEAAKAALAWKRPRLAVETSAQEPTA